MKYIKTYESYPKNNGRIKKGSYIFLIRYYDESFTKDKPYKVIDVNKLGDVKVYNDKGEINTISRNQYEKVNRKDIKFLLAMNQYNL